MAVSPNNTWDRLYRALRPLDPNNLDGPWAMILTGTTNIIGGGAGGTSMVDDNPFTPGGTSITPAGGYVGGRQVGSGHAAAPALSGSAIMQVEVMNPAAAAGALGTVGVYGSVSVLGSVNVGGLVSVVGSVRTTGVGGSIGVTQIGAPWSVVGSMAVTPATDFTVWLANSAGGGGFASAAVYGSPANPVYNVGSVNVVNPVGVLGVAGSVQVTGSVRATGAGGSMGVTQIGAPWSVVGSMAVTPATDFTVWLANAAAGGAAFASVAVYGSPSMPVYVVGTVNVSNPAAGGGFASVAVYGSPANPVYNVGSVNVVNAVGIFGSVSVIGSVNPHGVFAPAGSVNVVGSVGVTPLASFTVNLGSIPTVNLGLGTVNVGNAHGIFGSVSILGSVNIGGQPISVLGSVGATNLGGSVFSYIDARGLTTPTTWPLAFAGSGYLTIVPGLGGALRAKVNGLLLITTGTTTITFQSPSGTYLTGSMRLLPGAGIAMPPVSHWPVLQSAANATLFIHATGTENVGGALQGYIE